MPRFRIVLRAPLAFALLALTACAAVPPDRGVADLQKLVAPRSGPSLGATDSDTTALINTLLKAPLSIDDAVHVAWLNNPRVRREYARLGIAAAAVYDAGRLANPRVTVAGLLSNASGAANQVGFGVVQSFTDLLLLPARSRLATGEFERAKEQAGAVLLDLAADVDIAYGKLVGLQQRAALRQVAATTAHTAAELAQRYLEAGNLSALDLAKQRAAAASAQADSLQADSEVAVARSALNELLGLAPTSADWRTVAELPAPVDDDADEASLLALAQTSRLDLAAQRREMALLTAALNTARHFRYVGTVELGVETERQSDRSRLTGPTLSLELPVFNQGAGKLTRAQAQLEEAQSVLAGLELSIANTVHLQAQRAAAARNRAAQLRSQLIPAREELLKRTQQEVNYMLEGPFHLLEVKQQTYAAYQAYIEVVRDYWLARAELGRAVGTRLPVPPSPAATEHPGGAQ